MKSKKEKKYSYNEVEADVYPSSRVRKPRSRSQNDLDEFFHEKLGKLSISAPSSNSKDAKEKRNRSSSMDCTKPPKHEKGSALVFNKKRIKGEGWYEGYLTSDGKRTGTGCFKTDDFYYEGSWEADKPHGFGMHRHYTSGDRYEGSFQHGKRHGLGVFLWGNGDKFTGSFAAGCMDGLGRFEWFHGDVYHGQWKGGAIRGEGCLIGADGTVSEGSFQDGQLHGFAKKTFPNGDFYRGFFNEARLHGYGTYQWQDGHSYEGTWKVDNQHGVGRYITVIPTLANRDEITTYEGEFRDGAQLGLARVSIEGGDSVYIGETNNLTYSSTNKSNGESLSEICWGRIEYENGIVYEGECRDFVKEGRGVLMYDRILKGDTMDRFCQLDFTQITSTSKKEELDPHIQELLREVETTHLLIRSLDPIEISTQSSDNIYDILYQRGGMYHGDFLDDDPHGEGSFLLSNGQSYEVRYEHGVLVSVVPQP